MALSHHDNSVALMPTTKHLTRLMVSLILVFGLAICARAQNTKPSNTDESWTATNQTSIENTNPLRTMESHFKSGNRSVDKQRTEVLGPDGAYRPESDTETEAIQVDASTTRTVVRTYKWDANGQRRLLELTEQETKGSASGNAQAVRTTSNVDVNGNLQLVQREVADTKKTSSDAQETRTMVYRGDGNGGLTPSRQIREVQKRSSDNGVEVKKTTLVPGANGTWEVGEVREKTIREEGRNRTSEESVSRPDSEGRLSEVSRTVGEETENAAGEKTNTVETYSKEVSGVVDDGKLHLEQQVKTVQKSDSDRKMTEQEVERPNPGNPNDGLQVSGKNIYTVKYAASGTQQTKTVQVRNANGTFSVFSVETQKSDQIPPAQAPTESSDKPK